MLVMHSHVGMPDTCTCTWFYVHVFRIALQEQKNLISSIIFEISGPNYMGIDPFRTSCCLSKRMRREFSMKIKQFSHMYMYLRIARQRFKPHACNCNFRNQHIKLHIFTLKRVVLKLFFIAVIEDHVTVVCAHVQLYIFYYSTCLSTRTQLLAWYLNSASLIT